MKNIIGLWHPIHNLRQPGWKVCPVLLVLWWVWGMFSVAYSHWHSRDLGGIRGLPSLWTLTALFLANRRRNSCSSIPLQAWKQRMAANPHRLTHYLPVTPTAVGELAGGAVPSPGSLTFQETGPAPSHPPFFLHQWHHEEWMGQEARLLAFHTEAFVSLSRP